MPYNPGTAYNGYQLIYDALQRSAQQTNNFLYGFLMPNTPSADAGAGQSLSPDGSTAATPAKGPTLGQRFSAGAMSAAEGFDRFKQDADESNALEKLLKVLYPDQKTRIDTMSLGEKRGMLQAGQVQSAMQNAKQQALVRMLQATTAATRADNERLRANATVNKMTAPPAAPTGEPVLSADKQYYWDAYTKDWKPVKQPGSAPKEKPQRAPGEGPTVSKDGKFYWDDSTQAWKPVPAKGSSGMSLFNEPGDGGGLPTAATPKPNDADPLGLFSK